MTGHTLSVLGGIAVFARIVVRVGAASEALAAQVMLPTPATGVPISDPTLVALQREKTANCIVAERTHPQFHVKIDEVAAQYASLNTHRSESATHLDGAADQVQAALIPYQRLDAEIARLQKQLDTLRPQKM